MFIKISSLKENLLILLSLATILIVTGLIFIYSSSSVYANQK